MTSELVVDVQPKEVSIALLEDKSLVELQSEGRNISFSVGNMYLGRVKKLMPGLNACFVDVLAGLNAGMLCSGMMIVVFLEILRAVF